MTPLQDTLRHGWLSLITGSMECAIRPQDAPTVHADGPHPYRLLLLGGGVAAGLGVSRHDRALPGHLARHLASISGRGVDLDITARLGMTLSDARTEIDGRDLTGYDAIVLTLGTADALAALPTLQWRERFERLLTALLSKSHADTRILSLGTHPSPWAPYLHPYLTRRAARRLTDYNQICRELCWSLPRTSYLAPLDKPSAPTTQYAAGDYERIGRAVAAHLAHRLVGHPSSPTPSPDRPPRHVSPAGLGLLDHTPHIAVERIVARTQAAFGVERAAITELRGAEASPLISGGRRNGGTSPDSDSPAASAAKAGGLAITNVREDPRFQNSPWARRRGVTFYAAHPIYAPTGEAIAVLAIFDPQPRTFSRLEMGVLRDHAQLIQEVIARAHRTPAQQTAALGPPPVSSDDTDQERQREIGRRTSAGSQRSHTRAPSTITGAQWQ